MSPIDRSSSGASAGARGLNMVLPLAVIAFMLGAAVLAACSSVVTTTVFGSDGGNDAEAGYDADGYGGYGGYGGYP